MKRYFTQSCIIAAGLLASQILFTIFVYESNFSLLKSLEAISDAGYIAVPNAYVMSGLDAFLPAFCGGLFFTLTAGVGLTLGTFVIIHVWHSIFARRPVILFIFLTLWGFGIYKTSQTASPLILTTAFILVPAIVFISTIKWTSLQTKDQGWKSVVIHLAVILIVAGTWLPNMNADVFVNIRDQLLLSNPMGKMINSFYYHYTLYPAEAFKSLEQKQLKASRIWIDDPQLLNRVEKKLRQLDYLPVDKNIQVDLTVKSDEDQLWFDHRNRHIFRVKSSRFLESPESTLKKFSNKTDKMQFLRRFTFFSLLTASPLLLYLLIYKGLLTGLIIIREPKKRELAAAVLCVITGMAFAMALYQFQCENNLLKNKQAIDSLLQSKDWRARVKALKMIDANDLEITAHEADIAKLGKSSHVVERYWTAKALGNSDSEKIYEMLIQMLNDPHPNVVCMALYSLGNLNVQSATEDIKRVLISSAHWYIQWYAYNALKELGWIQPQST